MVRLHAALIATPLLLSACATPPRDEPPVRTVAPTPSSEPASAPRLPTVEVIAWGVIPTDHDTFGRIGGLSGALFREHRDENGERSPLDRRAMAPVEFVSDHPDQPRTLHAGLRLQRTHDGYSIEITFDYEDRLEWADATDAEAIARLPVGDGELYACAFEAPPTIVVREYDPSQPWRVRHRTPNIPQRVTEGARPNRAFESVAITPDATIWCATEAALETDGEEATTASGTRCVVLTGDAHALNESYFYDTDPMPRHLGGFAIQSLVELEALPDGRLLALERSLTLPAGYGARLFLLDGSTRPAPTDPAANPTRLPVLNKFLIADLAKLSTKVGVPWIGNLEGLALGPEIATLTGDPDERGRLLLVVADDNFGADIQKSGSRVLALRYIDD
ncbi:MAG: esterase-like activity of phytase family protein [Phycisphaerales bacterium]